MNGYTDPPGSPRDPVRPDELPLAPVQVPRESNNTLHYTVEDAYAELGYRPIGSIKLTPVADQDLSYYASAFEQDPYFSEATQEGIAINGDFSEMLHPDVAVNWNFDEVAEERITMSGNFAQDVRNEFRDFWNPE